MGKKNFIFTNRKHSKKGIMSIVLGVISSTAVFFAVYLTYQSGQNAPTNYGISLLLALLFSLVGFTIAVISRFEKDLFYFYSYIGIVINFIVIVAISVLLYAGAKGI